MSKIKRIINYYLLHQYQDDVCKDFADWFTAEQDAEQKDGLLRGEWESIVPQVSKHHIRRSYEEVESRIHRS